MAVSYLLAPLYVAVDIIFSSTRVTMKLTETDKITQVE